ncbi:MAG: hypothetical protein MI862_24415 [Desulfobacterales bacterium]|nr:hypothetical protein [Desulfobacterales bacterium]
MNPTITPPLSAGLISSLSKSTENSVSEAKPISKTPPLSYEEAKMAAGQAIRKVVGQLKTKFPPKTLQERAVEMLDEAENEKKTDSARTSETDSNTDGNEGEDSSNSNKSVDVYV